MYKVSPENIDVTEVVRAVEHPGAGAVVTFSGTVRDNADGRDVVRLEYEAIADMAEKLLRQIGDEAKSKHDILNAAIQHRTGTLEVGEISVFIAVSSAHRKDGFMACEYIINRIKEVLPVWKKEYYKDGTEWVDGTEVKE